MLARSVADLSDFPYSTFAALQDAHAHGRALVWVRFDFGAAWVLEPGGRFGNALLCGAGLWGALVFVVLAGVCGDPWLLCGAAACGVGAWCATPTPGCVSGGGCVAHLMLVAGALAALRLSPNALLMGAAGWLSWGVTSIGFFTIDAEIRRLMMQSEETFLWLLARGTVVRVEPAPPPEKAPPDETVWPPPPRAPDA